MAGETKTGNCNNRACWRKMKLYHSPGGAAVLRCLRRDGLCESLSSVGQSCCFAMVADPKVFIKIKAQFTELGAIRRYWT